MTILEIVSQKMRIYRATYRIRQAAFAKKAGLSQSTIAHIESGKKSPSLDTLEAIAKVMKMQPWELIKDDQRK